MKFSGLHSIFFYDTESFFKRSASKYIKINELCIFKAAHAAYGGSQARGRVGAAAASLHHSHSHAGSRPCL